MAEEIIRGSGNTEGSKPEEMVAQEREQLRLALVEALVEAGRARLVATPAADKFAISMSPKELGEIGAELMTPDKSATLSLRSPWNEKPLKEKYPKAMIDDGTDRKSERPSDILIDVSNVSLEKRIESLHMELRLNEEALGQAYEANNAFDALANAQTAVLERKQQVNLLEAQRTEIESRIDTIKQQFFDAVEKSYVPLEIVTSFNSIKESLEPQVEELTKKIEDARLLLNQAEGHLEELIKTYRTTEGEPITVLNRLTEEVIEAAKAVGEKRFRAQQGKMSEEVTPSVAPSEASLEVMELPPQPLLALLAKAVGESERGLLSPQTSQALAKAFPNIPIVDENGRLDPAGVWEAVSDLALRSIGGAVRVAKIPWKEFLQGMPPPKTPPKVPLPEARRALEEYRYRCGSSEKPSSLRLWAPDQRDSLVSHSLTIQSLYIPPDSRGILLKEFVRDRLFTAFDELGYDQRIALSRPPKDAPHAEILACELVENGLVSLQLDENHLDAINSRDRVSLFALPELYRKGLIPASAISVETIAMLAQCIPKLANYLKDIDPYLSTVIGQLDISRESDVNAVLRSLERIPEETRNRINNIIYASCLVEAIYSRVASFPRDLPFQPVNLELNDNTPAKNGITISASGWVSPVLAMVMSPKEITPVGTDEKPFTLTIFPDSRIVITGANAQGKTVFAQSLVAALMGYPVFAKDFTISGSKVAFEHIQQSLVPHFQTLKIPGLSTFQNVAVDVRRALTTGLPAMDESIQGTNRVNQERIIAALLGLTPQITVIHGAAEALNRILAANPQLEERIVPIVVDHYEPTVNEIALGSGGPQLLQALTPPKKFLEILFNEIQTMERSPLDKPNKPINFVLSKEACVVADYLQEHLGKFDDEQKITAAQQFLEGLGFQGEYGIFELKRILMLSLLGRKLSPFINEMFDIVLPPDAESILLAQALTSSDPNNQKDYPGIMKWWLERQGRIVPTTMIDLMRIAMLSLIYLGKPRAIRNLLTQSKSEVTPFLTDIQTALKEFFLRQEKRYEKAIGKLNDVWSACTNLLGQDAQTVMEALTHDSICKAARRSLRDILKRLESRLSEDTKKEIQWYRERSQIEIEGATATIKEITDEVINPVMEALFKDIPKSVLTDEEKKLIREDMTRLFFIEIFTDPDAKIWHSYDILPKLDKLDPQTAEVVRRWSRFFLRSHPEMEDYLPRHFDTGDVTEFSAKDVDLEKEKVLPERMAYILFKTFPLFRLHFLLESRKTDPCINAIDDAVYSVGYKSERLTSLYNDLKNLEARRQRAAELVKSYDTARNLPETATLREVLAAADFFLKDPSLLRAEVRVDMDDLVAILNAKNPAFELSRRVQEANARRVQEANARRVQEANARRVQEANEGMPLMLSDVAKAGSNIFEKRRALSELIEELIFQHVAQTVQREFGDTLSSENAARLYLDVSEFLSFAGWAQLAKALQAKVPNKSKGDLLVLNEPINLAVIARMVKRYQEVSSPTSTSPDSLRKTVEEALSRALKKYRRAQISFERGESTFITGPNASGKTTLAQAVAQNVILSALTGHVFANSATIPLFDGGVYLIQGGETTAQMSKFTSSGVGIVRALWDIVRHRDKHTLVILDEIATGTNPIEAQTIRAAVYRFLAQMPNVTVIIIDQESYGYDRLRELLGHPPKIIQLDPEHQVSSATEITDPGSIGLLTSDSIGDQFVPPMAPSVKQVFDNI